MQEIAKMDEMYINVFKREDGKMFMETKHREKGHINYIIYRQYISDDGVIYKKVLEVKSPRPYRLGQGCDGTIDSVVLALYKEWCDAGGLDADELLKQAYHDEDWRPDWKGIQALALWEGYVRPLEWDSEAEAGLLASLTEINYHSLVDVVSEHVSQRAWEMYIKSG